METEKLVAKRIREIRKSKGLKGRELARKGGFSPEYLSRIELSKLENPSIEFLSKVARALDEPIYNLFSENNLIPEKDISADITIKVPQRNLKKNPLIIKVEEEDEVGSSQDSP